MTPEQEQGWRDWARDVSNGIDIIVQETGTTDRNVAAMLFVANGLQGSSRDMHIAFQQFAETSRENRELQERVAQVQERGIALVREHIDAREQAEKKPWEEGA